MADTYLDFELEIDRTEQEYRVDVKGTQAEQNRLTIPASQIEFDLDGFLEGIGRPARGLLRNARRAGAAPSDPGETLEEFGSELFRTFLAGANGLLFYQSLRHVKEQDAGLRIRMQLTGVPELAQLPWEYLYDPMEDDFVTPSSDTVLIRQPRVPTPIESFAVSPPLRILVVIASPQDLFQLDVEREWHGLKEALSGLEQEGLVAVDLLDRATKKRLQEKLEAEDYHIIHFVGHGDFDPEGDTASFYMETVERQADPLSTRALRRLLRDVRTLRLVVLNACKGARTAAGDPFAGLAQGLMRAGIPAVIAMQFAITDETAIHFAREFYQRVAQGRAIDRALGEVRKSISVNVSELEWGTPVLFMRSRDGQIFDVSAKQAQPPDEPEQAGSGIHASNRSAVQAGSGNIAVTGDVQGGLTITQGAPSPSTPPLAHSPVGSGEPNLGAVRDLLLAAFTAQDLRRLFMYTSDSRLRPLVREFSPNDGLADMADKAIEFCLVRGLLPELLREVEKANPRQYARFASRL